MHIFSLTIKSNIVYSFHFIFHYPLLIESRMKLKITPTNSVSVIAGYSVGAEIHSPAPLACHGHISDCAPGITQRYISIRFPTGESTVGLIIRRLDFDGIPFSDKEEGVAIPIINKFLIYEFTMYN